MCAVCPPTLQRITNLATFGLLKFHLLRQEQVVLSNFSVGNWCRSGNLHCRHNQHLRSRSPHPVNPKTSISKAT